MVFFLGPWTLWIHTKRGSLLGFTSWLKVKIWFWLSISRISYYIVNGFAFASCSAILQIQHKYNGDIVLLAPPLPLEAIEAFTAAMLTAIISNTPSRMVNGNKKPRRGRLMCITFVPLLLMNCTNHQHSGAPLPLAATKALCSSATHHRSLKWAKAHGACWKNRQIRGRFGFQTVRP